MFQLSLLSLPSKAPHSDTTKPETTILAECSGIRERLPSELVHHKKRQGQTHCLLCHKPGFIIWSPSQDKHSEHPMRCC